MVVFSVGVGLAALVQACADDPLAAPEDSGAVSPVESATGMDASASPNVAPAPLQSNQQPIEMPPRERQFVPEHLEVMNLSGEAQALQVFAATLRDGANGLELMAAFRNGGEVSACDAAASFEFFDSGGQSLGAWVGGLYSDLYRRDDGSGGLVSCVDPGQEAMLGLMDFAPALSASAVATAVYQVTYFARDILPFELSLVDELRVSEVRTIDASDGKVFAGALHNGLEGPLSGASVTIFPINDVGRPLGIATSVGTKDVAPNGTWDFETTSVAEVGTDFVAYPAGTLTPP